MTQPIPDFPEIADQQGWTPATCLSVIVSFIGSRGLEEALGEYAQEIADEENGEET